VDAAAPATSSPQPVLSPADAALQARQDQFASAIVKRDAQAVRALLRSGLNPNFNFNDLLPRGRSFESPLTLAIYRGHLDIARILIEGGADPRRKDGEGRSPIHQARSAGAVKLLVEAGADLEARDKHGQTAAASALERGDLAAVDTLVAQGARLEVPAGGKDFFVRAIESRNPQMIQALLDRGVDPRSPPTKALWLLIDSGDTERAKLLVQRGADPNATRDQGSLLAHALFRKRWEIAGALVDAGASLGPADPPACGVGFRHCPSIELARLASFDPKTLARLKAKGLDLDAVARDGHTALTSIVVDRTPAVRALRPDGTLGAGIPAPDNIARAKALLDLGADANRKYREATPLMLAIGTPGVPREMADMLLGFGARIEVEATIPKPGRERADPAGSGEAPITNDQGLFTGMKVGPLTWAMFFGRPDIAVRLVERDRIVSRADRDLLCFAAATGHWDLVMGALPYTREADAADRADRTPLLFAAHAGQADVVRALLSAGAKVNVRSARNWPPLLEADLLSALSGHPSRPTLVGGYTALRAARERGHQEVAKFLEAAGGRE
jgi:ankyrin repeat protein